MWGAEDLVASLGGTSSRHADGSYRDVARAARANVLLAAGAAGIPAIDTVHLDIDDLDGLRAEAEDAAASGFAATACIHPSHVAVIREAYASDGRAGRLGDAGAGCRGRRTRACSASRAAWSTARCCGTRRPCCDEAA